MQNPKSFGGSRSSGEPIKPKSLFDLIHGAFVFIDEKVDSRDFEALEEFLDSFYGDLLEIAEGFVFNVINNRIDEGDIKKGDLPPGLKKRLYVYNSLHSDKQQLGLR